MAKTFQEWLDTYEGAAIGEYCVDDLKAAFEAGEKKGIMNLANAIYIPELDDDKEDR